MRLKEIIPAFFVFLICGTLCGCTNGSVGSRSANDHIETVSSTVSTSGHSASEESDAESSAGYSDERVIGSKTGSVTSSASEPSPAEPGDDVIGDLTAAELVSRMKIGWNLGNTLDATGGWGLDSETSWGNITTTKQNIDTVKAAGFNVLRVPVSWGNHLDAQYNINPAWLDRVQEVVDYGYDNGMFVILNTHHEEWYMPRPENLDHDLTELEALWKQIAERFNEYGERLIFEGVNEPRLRGDGVEWTGNDSAREIVNKYAETFVKTVRATGGNNADRILMVSPYAASSAEDNQRALRLPEDRGKLIVSVHAYSPYSFALDTHGTADYSSDIEIRYVFDTIKKTFLDKNIPVVIGEFGAVNKNNIEARLKWAREFLAMAKQSGVPCLWWDNGLTYSDGENFGLLDRENNTWHFPALVEALTGPYSHY